MSDTRVIFKVCRRSEWNAAVALGRYEGSDDDRRDGFIHLSTQAQLAGTLARHFRDEPDLVLVAFDSAALGADLRWEPSRGGQLFPHLYAPLDPASAASTRTLAVDVDGIPALGGEHLESERS
ncbi:MAG: DUF952 domain-containing protein [Hyphomicrobiaceae bacterium]